MQSGRSAGHIRLMVLQTLDSLGPLRGYAIAARMAGIIHTLLHGEA